MEIFSQTNRLDLAEAYNPGYTFAPQNGNDTTDATGKSMEVTEKEADKDIDLKLFLR